MPTAVLAKKFSDLYKKKSGHYLLLSSALINCRKKYATILN